MAGPGGGPPRKSHTKSRKGCRTCKKRHIRCDETFPQCRNCTKHNCRCDYMDMPAAGEEPMKGGRPPDLLMDSELQHRIDSWRVTGDSLLPELQVGDPIYWTKFSTIDLRLIHHIVTLSTDMQNRGYSHCTAWASRITTLLAVAVSHGFVMSALLALSASHLAWQTKNADTENLAYHHRGVALKGLHDAIGDFSRDNSDAILAASMLLSWQTTEWRSWASLQQGVSTVMNAMRPWAHESELAMYLDSQRSIARARTPSTPTFVNSHPIVPSEDLRRVEQISNSLHNLKMRLAHNEELAEYADQLLEFLTHLQQELPIQSPEQAFLQLQPLRDFIFWLAPALLQSDDSDIAALTLLSHLYAIALALEPLFPEIGGAYLGSMCLFPVERILDILRSRRNSQPQEQGYQTALSLVETPMQVVAAYKIRFTHVNTRMEAYRVSPQASPYGGAHVQLASIPDSTPTLYSNSPALTSQNLVVPATSYFPPITSNSNMHRGSPGHRSVSMSDRSTNAGSPLSMQLPYSNYQTPGHLPSQPRSSHETSSKVDYFGQLPYQPYGTSHMHNRDSASLPPGAIPDYGTRRQQ